MKTVCDVFVHIIKELPVSFVYYYYVEYRGLYFKSKIYQFPTPVLVLKTSPKHTFSQKFGTVFRTLRGNSKNWDVNIYHLFFSHAFLAFSLPYIIGHQSLKWKKRKSMWQVCIILRNDSAWRITLHNDSPWRIL